jgi:hypothetical protein
VREARGLARGVDRVYIGIGSEEIRIPGGEQLAHHFRTSIAQANQGLVKLCEALAANLQQTYFYEPEVHLVVQQGAKHDPKFWRERFPDAISFLYGNAETVRH